MQHSLEHTHHVVVVGPRALNVEGDELGEVTVGVALFCTERRSDFKHALQASAHAELFEQLGRLVQERRTIEVLHGEEIGAPFGGGRHDFWRVRLKKSFRNQMFSPELQHLSTESKHGVDMSPPEVHEPVVKSGAQRHVDAVRDPQG